MRGMLHYNTLSLTCLVGESRGSIIKYEVKSFGRQHDASSHLHLRRLVEQHRGPKNVLQLLILYLITQKEQKEASWSSARKLL